MTLTWSRTTEPADADRAQPDGVSGFGREVAREINRVGVRGGIAHVAPPTMCDPLKADGRSAHIEQIRSVTAVHALDIGGDYDGCDALPRGLTDALGDLVQPDELRRRERAEVGSTALPSQNVLDILTVSDDDHRALTTGKTYDAAAGEAVKVSTAVIASAVDAEGVSE